MRATRDVRGSKTLKGRVLGGDEQFSAFPCAFAPHPPNPLLPQGEKGEFGRPEAQNERRNAGASQKPTPGRSPNPLLPHGEKGESGCLDARNGRWCTGAFQKTTPASLLLHGERGEFICPEAQRVTVVAVSPASSHPGRRTQRIRGRTKVYRTIRTGGRICKQR
jgi:hypothetical protein